MEKRKNKEKTSSTKKSRKSKVEAETEVDNKSNDKVEQTKLNSFVNLKEKSNSFELSGISLPEIKQGQQLRIYSWNINGLRAVTKKNDFKNFIDKEKADILALNETKISDENLKNESSLKNIAGNGYEGFFNCCQTKKGYSGVAIFTKYKPISVVKGIGISKHDEEGRALTMEFNDFFVIATYIPNAGQNLVRLKYRVEEWDKAFQEYLIGLSSKKNVIWLGDINVCPEEIDIANPKGNLRSAGFTIEERNSFKEFLDKGFIDTFRKLHPETVKYSYFSNFGNAREKNKGWRLDNIVVNQKAMENVVESEILNEYYGSDHCPIKLTWGK